MGKINHSFIKKPSGSISSNIYIIINAILFLEAEWLGVGLLTKNALQTSPWSSSVRREKGRRALVRLKPIIYIQTILTKWMPDGPK